MLHGPGRDRPGRQATKAVPVKQRHRCMIYLWRSEGSCTEAEILYMETYPDLRSRSRKVPCDSYRRASWQNEQSAGGSLPERKYCSIPLKFA